MDIKISEIFKGIEGEGILAGTPTAFIRFASCNLKCSWCDTAYASRKGVKHRLMSPEEVAVAVKRIPLARVSVTGGEPVHQARGLLELLEILREEWRVLHLETNATEYLPRLSSLCHQVSLSPKLPSSGNKQALKPTVVRSFLRSGVALQLKFVVKEGRDWAAMTDFVEKVKPPMGFPLVVQPAAAKGALSRYASGGAPLAVAFEKHVASKPIGKRYNWRFLGQWQHVWWRGKRGR